MNETKDFKQHLNQLQILVGIQRSSRLLLRLAWLGLGVHLLLWSANRLWGWNPGQGAWVLIGSAFALSFLISILLFWPRKFQFTWSLDRRMGLDEQVSTAWQVLVNQEPGILGQELIKDVYVMLPQISKRILINGWFLKRDFLSLLILFLFAATFFLGGESQSLPGLADEFQVLQIEVLKEDPRVEDVFPQGLLGIKPENNSEGSSSQGDTIGNEQSGMNPEQVGRLREALSKLGEQLSQMASTHELGQALKEMELEEAAAEIEKLTDLTDNLSNETKNEMKANLEQAASSLQSDNTELMQELAEDLQEVAKTLDSLQSQEQSLSNKLSDLADDFRKLEKELGKAGPGGPGAGDSERERGQVESSERLSGSGESFDINLNDPSLSGLLNPSPSEKSGEGLVYGIIETIQKAGIDTIQSFIIPYYYIWTWHELVSTYFQH